MHQNLSTIIRWYKGRCGFEMRKHMAGFAWLYVFHDHIIREVVFVLRIQQYMEDNPGKLKK